MNVNLENPSVLRRKMTIELGPDEIKSELDRTYNELKRNVHLKGFRPGRAPRQLLERFFGDQVRGEVIQKLIKESTEKALAERELKPVVEPEIITEESDLTKSLRFSAVFDVKPEFTVKDYQGLKVQAPSVEVQDHEVAAELERVREKQATLKPVEGRTVVQSGDIVIGEVEGYENGQPVQGTKTSGQLLEVSEQALPHGIHEMIVGAELKQQVKGTKTYPEDYSIKEFAGKTIEWRATIGEIFSRELPRLDDEFAKDQAEGFKTLEEFREHVRKHLLEQATRRADARVRQGLLDLVIERNPLEVPESLVEAELRSMDAEMAVMLQLSGMSREQALERASQSREERKPQAEKRARSGLIVDAIADQEAVTISDDELAKRIGEEISSSRNRDRTSNYYSKEENRTALRAAMRREKTVDLLLSRAQVGEDVAQDAGAGKDG